ncbi:uracil-DNA glycosylase [Pontibacillus halophilus JSM 076056 = DSM 19796]|uniref:Uracil-DNA glycosylase n=1 Tax=Pontibacillus halophilus JSM 076056 = DSM 19796 TaxID=1385510 RepID=A0A0A5GIX3_9BACI|nr:uracil-DNA glycosylase [Pontibacillus halophilus]KGX91954.1 uracil-DNA glycosylase [Pontibacillus halophilus JSM 076056 = DSM 19796]
MIQLAQDWKRILSHQFEQPYYIELREFLKKEYEQETVYPNMHDIYNALYYTSFEQTKVVILGQDPYHGPDQAHGFSFSVKPGVKLPPSLRNMYKELQSDIGVESPNHGYLLSWAKQGVLLLNTVLTVRKGQAHSHKRQGWEMFTDEVIASLNDREEPTVFLLWGKPAQSKRNLIDETKHYVLTAPHPSPLSAHRGFFGSRHFSKTNEILEATGQSPIEWQLPMDPYPDNH